MKILIIGMGIVGKTTARGFGELGHTVICRDIGGDRPVSDACFICTPEKEVNNAIKDIETNCLVVRSTTAPSTIMSLGGHICHNPCFIREKTAHEDFIHPPMIVIGECCKDHGDILEELYSDFDSPIFRIDITTSEMVKLALNCYLAMLISFWNEVKGICDKLGISSMEVSKVCQNDSRISKYGALRQGYPFDGRCLPKDLKCMIKLFKSEGVAVELLEAVETVNRNLESELHIASRIQ